MKLRNKDSMPVLGGFLGAVALLAAAVLAMVSQLTAQPIKAAQERNRQQIFHRLGLPEFDRAGVGEECGEVMFFTVFKGNETVGFVGQGSAAGYGGAIEVLTGFDRNGKITGVQILRHRETPGLGANVCERKFQRTIFNLTVRAPEVPANKMLDQFTGKNASESGNWQVAKDGGKFEYLTGATVTSRAVTGAVDDIAAGFLVWRKKIEGEGRK